jgi:hypothetical protein
MVGLVMMAMLLAAQLLELDSLHLHPTVDPQETDLSVRQSMRVVTKVLAIDGQSVVLFLHSDHQLEVVTLATRHSTVSSLRLPLAADTSVQNNVVFVESRVEVKGDVRPSTVVVCRVMANDQIDVESLCPPGRDMAFDDHLRAHSDTAQNWRDERSRGLVNSWVHLRTGSVAIYN